MAREFSLVRLVDFVGGCCRYGIEIEVGGREIESNGEDWGWTCTIGRKEEQPS